MRLDDFMRLKEAADTKLTRAMVAALHFYTSHSFTAINQPLRDRDRKTQHLLSAITINIQEGIKKMGSKNERVKKRKKKLLSGAEERRSRAAASLASRSS